MQKHNSFFDARFKLATALLVIIFIVSTSVGNYLTFLAYFLVVILCIVLFRPKPLFFLKRALIVFLFPLSVSLFIPFITPGNVLYGIELGSVSINVTDAGSAIFLTTLIKSFLAILALTAIITSSTDLEILHGLRKLHFPKIMVSIIFLMYRYLFLIRDEARAGSQAINARVFKRSYRVVNKRLAFLAGNLLLKSFDRAENIYKSMESRGYDGNFYYIDDKKYGKKELVSGVIFLTVIICFLIIIKYFELRVF